MDLRGTKCSLFRRLELNSAVMPTSEKKSKRDWKGAGRVALCPPLASGAQQEEDSGMSV